MSDMAVSSSYGDLASRMLAPQNDAAKISNDTLDAQTERRSERSVNDERIDEGLKKAETQESEIKHERVQRKLIDTEMVNFLQQELNKVENEPEELPSEMLQKLREMSEQTIASARQGGVIIDVEI